MRVLGLDGSTKTGAVCLEDGELVLSKWLDFRKERGFHRLQLIAQSIRSVVLDCKPDVVYIEGYGFGNKHTLVVLVEVGTTIRMELHRAGVPWVEVAPTKLKLATVGSGAADKAAMATAVAAKWGFTSLSDDVIDAYALAQYGLAQTLTKTGA